MSIRCRPELISEKDREDPCRIIRDLFWFDHVVINATVLYWHTRRYRYKNTHIPFTVLIRRKKIIINLPYHNITTLSEHDLHRCPPRPISNRVAFLHFAILWYANQMDKVYPLAGPLCVLAVNTNTLSEFSISSPVSLLWQILPAGSVEAGVGFLLHAYGVLARSIRRPWLEKASLRQCAYEVHTECTVKSYVLYTNHVHNPDIIPKMFTTLHWTGPIRSKTQNIIMHAIPARPIKELTKESRNQPF